MAHWRWFLNASCTQIQFLIRCVWLQDVIMDVLNCNNCGLCKLYRASWTVFNHDLFPFPSLPRSLFAQNIQMYTRNICTTIPTPNIKSICLPDGDRSAALLYNCARSLITLNYCWVHGMWFFFCCLAMIVYRVRFTCRWPTTVPCQRLRCRSRSAILSSCWKWDALDGGLLSC